VIKSIVRASAVVALVAGGFALTWTVATGEGPKACEACGVQGTIVQTFSHEHLIEIRVERVCDVEKTATEKEAPEETSGPSEKKNDAKKSDQKSCSPRASQVIFVDVSAAKVTDEKGVERLRDDKSAWFVKDAGWAVLKDCQRVKVQLSGTQEVPAPQSFPSEMGSKGRLLVYVATSVDLLPATCPDLIITRDFGSADGSIVQLFAKDKVIELRVEKACRTEDGIVRNDTMVMPGDKTILDDKSKLSGPRSGEVIFLHVTDAVVFDAKGKERLRDDKAAWFTKDDGWSILKAGHHVTIDFIGTHEIPAPKEFLGALSGKLLVYHVSVIYCHDDK
jgi:hypothetical protein